MVLDAPGRRTGGDAGPPAVACGPAQCLAVWQQGWLVGRRLSLQGEPLDDDVVPIALNYANVAPLVCASDSGDYLVAWPVDGLWHATFVSAADGSVSDSPPVVLSNPDDPATIEAITFSDGAHHILYHKRVAPDVDQRFIARVEPNGLATLSGGIDLGVPATLKNASLNAGGQQLLYAIKNKLQRIDLDAGSVLDPVPFEVSKLAYGPFASDVTSAFDGQNHVVVWIDSGKLYAARLRASDGQLFDADDSGSMLPGARVLCQLGSAFRPRAKIAAGRLNVSWQTNSELHAASFALDPWTSSSAACAGGTGFELQVLAPVSVSHGAAGVAVVNEQSNWGVRSIGFTISDLGLVTASHEGTLNYTGTDLTANGLLSNGRDFLIGNGRLERIDGVTGERLDHGPGGEEWGGLVANGADIWVGLRRDCASCVVTASWAPATSRAGAHLWPAMASVAWAWPPSIHLTVWRTRPSGGSRARASPSIQRGSCRRN